MIYATVLFWIGINCLLVCFLPWFGQWTVRAKFPVLPGYVIFMVSLIGPYWVWHHFFLKGI